MPGETGIYLSKSEGFVSFERQTYAQGGPFWLAGQFEFVKSQLFISSATNRISSWVTGDSAKIFELKALG